MTDEAAGPAESEEKFVDFIQRNAKDYNATAGDVPREAMWAAITAARAEAKRAQAARRRRVWVVAGMAATLALGVALGRMGRPEAEPAIAGRTDAGAATATYDKVTVTHLVGAEAMLMSFTSAGSQTHTDTSVTRWAKDLLTNTRLLLDSPAATDANRRRLLQDLERVLVQIVQQSPAESDAEVRAHVERSMDRTHMIRRLRALQEAATNGGS